MLGRFLRGLTLFAAVCFWIPPGALAQVESPPPFVPRNEQPVDTLSRRLEPGPGFSVSNSHWSLVKTGTDRRVWTDSQTGLSVAQTVRWLPDVQLAVIDARLSNETDHPVTLDKIAWGDWTLRIFDDQDSLAYRDLAHRDDTWYESTYWTGPNWTRVGKDWSHPGENTPAVRRWTAPRDGTVTISGRVYKAHVDKKTDGVGLTIRHGRDDVWTAQIDGADAKGVEPNVSLDVRQGDCIRFIVDKRVVINCDTTHWDPTVAYDDGDSYQASAGFARTLQSDNPWSYEMVADGAADSGLPRWHSLTSDLTLREESITPRQAVGADAQSNLPIVVLADGRDQSGLVLAVTQSRAAASQRDCRLTAELAEDGRLRVRVVSRAVEPIVVPPGGGVEFPRLVLGPYQGPWVCGITALERLFHSPDHAALAGDLPQRFSAAFLRATAPLNAQLEPDLATAASHQTLLPKFWIMLQNDWRQADKLVDTVDSYREATARHDVGARALLADLRQQHGLHMLATEAEQLDRLAAAAAGPDLSLDARRSLYYRTRWLKRRIVLANPLLDFGPMVFCKRAPTSYSHLVMQYYGWQAQPGGGLFILDNPGYSLECRDILRGKLSGGNVLEPRLSYDARRIVFSYVECDENGHDFNLIDNNTDVGFYHIYDVGVDGLGLRQLTSGPYDDLMPTYLPDGGVAFSSTRRRGYARCFGGQFSRRWHVYTLHRIDGDGGDLRTLSFHDTNEWFPTVSRSGHILYARWDYIDRDAVTHQNLWASRPDGTNPVAVWGNATSSPHCTFQLQPIPNSSKIVFTASAHHSVAGGSIAVVDPTVSDNGHGAITRITPEIPFPEAEGRDIDEYYTSPWPLSEKYFLVGYCGTPLVWEPGANATNGLGIYVLDVFGNRELIYRDPLIGATNPCPLVARPAPPALPSSLPENAPPLGEVVLADVTQGLGDVEPGHVKQLRVVQIFPKTTNVANVPPIGMAREENGRAILGTVPVEADGSARFLLPAKIPVLFQALDERGFAYQTMRTVTYVQPGERITCVGCHENRMSAPVDRTADLIALGRAPSRIDPGAFGGRPFSYMEVVQPILDRHCVDCHGDDAPDGNLALTSTPLDGYSRSYVSLCGDVDFWSGGTNPESAARALVPRFGGRNQVQVTPPGGLYGALGSRLLDLLVLGHEDVELTDQEIRSLAAWIDMNAIFYGVNLPDEQARQMRGEVIGMPEIQ